MDVGVERVGAVSLQRIAAATRNEIATTLAGKAKVTETPIKLASGAGAELLHVVAPVGGERDRRVPGRPRSDRVRARLRRTEEVLVRPTARRSPQSAATFTFVPAPNLSRLVLSGAAGRAGYKVARSRAGRASSARRPSTSATAPIRARHCAPAACRCTYTHPAKTVAVSNEVVTYVPRRRAGGAGRGAQPSPRPARRSRSR